VTPTEARGPVVVDTDVYGASLVPGSKLAERYEPLIVGRPAFISFQTVAELRYGASLRGWGSARMRKLDAKISNAEVVHTGPGLIEVYVGLRVDCERSGHGLAQRIHDADRWIAATALRLGIPLVSNDGIFDQVPGLTVLTA
jgi:predicted nucleic acid-binding protein